ncbi:UDP-glucuronic acid decarboxylase 1 [Platysternon megacephalum]|uniref:UDP-glucuronic acid decarboxylase 1 n=1 Tax=Platysternon megacephalum TaxID=55544 RepID=A0A4D9EDA3_9SAUR|nr:UDP-glucuronic acid decarboxylase 1 [Platysternon megacephalum]
MHINVPKPRAIRVALAEWSLKRNSAPMLQLPERILELKWQRPMILGQELNSNPTVPLKFQVNRRCSIMMSTKPQPRLQRRRHAQQRPGCDGTDSPAPPPAAAARPPTGLLLPEHPLPQRPRGRSEGQLCQRHGARRSSDCLTHISPGWDRLTQGADLVSETLLFVHGHWSRGTQAPCSRFAGATALRDRARYLGIAAALPAHSVWASHCSAAATASQFVPQDAAILLSFDPAAAQTPPPPLFPAGTGTTVPTMHRDAGSRAGSGGVRRATLPEAAGVCCGKMLPTTSVSSPNQGNGALNSRDAARHTAGAKRYKYLRRLLHFRQMDFEFAVWQMLYLFTSPQRVYRNFHYRKQTKDQWARDDPAFLVLLSIWLCVSTIGFGFVLNMGFFQMIKLLLWVVFIDCVGVGLLIATLMWFISNRYLVKRQSRDYDVEWGYAFDVHLNAFYPLLVILHFIQLFFINYVISSTSFMGYFVGNTVWLIAIGYYIYVTFLGYSALPFLKNTVILLYPFALLILLYVLSLALGWNFTKTLCTFYEFRVK